jgi:hypothetical protein
MTVDFALLQVSGCTAAAAIDALKAESRFKTQVNFEMD